MLTRFKLPVITPFTFKINIHELSKISFEICECIRNTIPSSFKFDNVSSYETLLTVENNDFINDLKDFFYLLLDEKNMEFLYKKRQLHSPESLYEEQQMFNFLDQQEKFLEETITEYTEKLQVLPARFKTHKENITGFLTSMKRSKESQRRYLANSEEKLSKEYIQNYYLNGCKYYNKSIHTDETLILCHLTWYKKPHKVIDKNGNIVKEIQYFETVQNNGFIEAFNEANNNAFTYSEVYLYQDLMKAYTHTIIKSEYREQYNEMLILLPAEIYQALMQLSFNKVQPFETTPGDSTIKINAAYNFEITKEAFQDEAFKETLISLIKDNKMSFTEIVKTAWNLQD